MDKTNDNVSETMTDAVKKVIDGANEGVSCLTSKVNTLTGSIGHQVKGFAEKVRAGSPHEKVRATTYGVADRLESAGTYLEGKDLKTMINDTESLIRRYPVKSLLIGVGIGFLLSRGRGR